MIGISRLYCGTAEASDRLRYGTSGGERPGRAPDAPHKRPVVVWNCTRRCNLRCVHCYAGSYGPEAYNELTTTELHDVLDDLASFGSPVVLFSGGEPLMHPCLLELAEHAVGSGMRAVISTNGTLIGREKAEIGAGRNMPRPV